MFFTTQSGSVYEVDSEAKKVRQVKGRSTNRLHRTGVGGWAPFEDIVVEAGRSAIIVWPEGTPLLEGSPEGATPSTITSRVTEVRP